MIDQASWYVYSHASLIAALKRYTVAVIGSGAWACAAAKMVAQVRLLHASRQTNICMSCELAGRALNSG